MKTLPSLLIASLFATLTFAVWAWLNRPTLEPPWPAHIQGFAFSPFRANEDPTHLQMPTDAEIDSDLALLEGTVNAVRTYSVEKTLADVPELAERHDLNVALGAWIDAHRDNNELQLQTAIALANTHINVVRVIIGNEVIFRGDLPIELLDRQVAAEDHLVADDDPHHVDVGVGEGNGGLQLQLVVVAVSVYPGAEGDVQVVPLGELGNVGEGLLDAVGAHRIDRALEQREVRVDLRIGGHLQVRRVLVGPKRREGESLDVRRPGGLARRAVEPGPYRERQCGEQRRDQETRQRFHARSGRLPAAAVGHRLPRFGGRERCTLLQQLDGNVVRRAHESHVPV